MTSENSKSIIPENSKTDIQQVFKDSYVFDFLNLPEQHSEGDLQNGLINRMKEFILELGRDFIFIGNEYKLMAVIVIFTLTYCFIIGVYNVLLPLS